MTDLNSVELHDALLISISINYAEKTMTISVECYQDAVHDRGRQPARIIFEGVYSISHTVDLDALQDNASVGNIEYWAPHPGGTTYIYLVDGSIAVCARSLRFESYAA